MKLLVLGLPRTGTQSLADALEILGISPVYHMREVGKMKHEPLWIEALEAKLVGKGEPWTARKDFDRILDKFQGLLDVPAVIFAEELINAYPEADIILTVRDEQAWHVSMMTTLWHAHCNFPKKPIASLYHRHIWGDDFPNKGLEAYRKHNDTVRQAAHGRRFLEYQASQGWGPLCDFLGVQVPDQSFPRSDDWVAYKALHASG